MRKGKGGKYEERTDGIIQILHLLEVYVLLLSLPHLFFILVLGWIADGVRRF